MTLKDFLYACDVVRLEDGLEFSRPDSPTVPQPSPADNKARNATSMAMLQGMMSGVKKGKR